MRISIVTPSYNQADFLEATLCSVLDQGYPDLDYWVMDGGSSDGSVEIIRKYAEHLTGWVSERDSGQGEAINKGFARCTGEIIGWVNSDDLYLPGTLARIAAAFQDSPNTGMIFGDVLSIDAAGEAFNVMRYGDWGLDDLMQFHILGQPGVFMRHDVLRQAGLLDPNYHYMLDHHLWLRMAMRAPMQYIPQPLAAARYHAQAKNIALAASFGAEAYRIIDWMQAQPQLAERFARQRGRIWAGAHLFNARYLQDGGKATAALKSYARAITCSPRVGLREWRRMTFAAAGLVLPIESLKARYLQNRRRRMADALKQMQEDKAL